MHDEGLKLRPAVIDLNRRPRSRPTQRPQGRARYCVRSIRAPVPNAEDTRRVAPFLGVKWIGLATLLAALGFCVSCRSLPPLPPVDLSAPGWRVQQGQALWKPRKTRPELAGELLLATNANGDSLVQFSKTPFTLATAQRVGDRWQVDLGAGDYRRSGHGQPPAGVVWFQLPRFIALSPQKPTTPLPSLSSPSEGEERVAAGRERSGPGWVRGEGHKTTADGVVRGDWHFDRVMADSWRLENHRTGETLEGGFFP